MDTSSYQHFLDEFINDKTSQFDSQIIDINQYPYTRDSTICSIPDLDLDISKELEELDQEFHRHDNKQPYEQNQQYEQHQEQYEDALEITQKGLEELDLSYQEPVETIDEPNPLEDEQILDPGYFEQFQEEETPTRHHNDSVFPLKSLSTVDNEQYPSFQNVVDNHEPLFQDTYPNQRTREQPNQDILIENHRLKEEIDHLHSQNQSLQSSFQKSLQELKQTHATELSQLQKQVQSVFDIKQTLQKEKEIDVLMAKKEILEQQEIQLFQLQREMNAEKEKLKSMYEDQVFENSQVVQVLKQNGYLDREGTKVVQVVQDLVISNKKMQQELFEKEKSISELNERTDSTFYQLQKSRSKVEELVNQLQGLETLYEDKLIKVKLNHETMLEQAKKEFLDEKKGIEERYLESLQMLRGKTEVHTLEELIHAYPSLMTNFRQQLDHSFDSKLESLLQLKQVEIEGLKDDIKNLENEKKKLEAQVQDVGVRVKEECTMLYDQSLRNLVSEYKEMEKQVLKKFQTTIGEYQRHVSQLQQALIEKSQEVKVFWIYEVQIERMEIMRQKYVDTLKQMKEELVKSKDKSLKRLESEWRIRKERLDAEWQNRLYERLKNCRCN